MRWEGRRQSDNIEDRRGMRVSRGGLVGGGLGTIAIALLIIFMGGDPTPLLQGAGEGPVQTTQEPYVGIAGRSEWRQQTRRHVLADTEDVWSAQFKDLGGEYRKPKLVLFQRRASIRAAAWPSPRMGPFYCPPDEKRLHRPDFLQGDGRQAPCGRRLRARLRRCARSRSPRAEPARHLEPGAGAAAARAARSRATSFPSASNCRPTALRASGRNTQRQVQASSSRATSRKAIDCRDRGRRRPPADAAPAGRSCRIPSRTAASEQRMRWFTARYRHGLRRACDTFKAADL